MKNERAEMVVEEEENQLAEDDIIAWSGQICKFTTKHFSTTCTTTAKILALHLNKH